MEIRILQLIEGAKQAEGTAVIIDVFRAFSTACYVMENGGEKIVPVGEINLAYELKRKHPEYILMGERDGKKQPGFDYGNSPTHIENVDFSGKTVVLTTSAGTQGIVNAVKANEILTGSFVNASSVAEYVRKQSPDIVSLVCMGNAGVTEADEDVYCARYIKSMLESEEYDFGAAVESLRRGSGRRLFDPANQAWSPQRDFDLCLARDQFDFVLKAMEEDNGLTALRKHKAQ